MDFTKTLKQIDDALAPEPQTVDMTSAQFEAYVHDQLEKAAKEKKDKDEKVKEKAKKRLEHLKATVESVSKAMWEGTNGTQAIPVFNEPGLTNDSERTEKEIPVQNMSSMDNSAWAGAGGPQGFAKNLDALQAVVSGLVGEPAATNGAPAVTTQKTGDQYAWPADIANAEFQKEGVSKSAPAWGKDSEAAPTK